MQRILYFHGLNGTLSEEKRRILEVFFDVYAPQLNYEFDNIDQLIEELLPENTFDAIIGNSMGGYVAYHLSRQLNVPSLLFNPALKERSTEIQFTPYEHYGNHLSLVYAVLGKADEIVSPNGTWEELFSDNQNDRVIFSCHRKLEHRIDENTFKAEVERFVQFLAEK